MDEDNLRYAEFVDLPATIPVIKRRKLVIVSKFLANNGFLNAAITAAEIQQSRKAPAGVAAPIYHASVPDPHRGAPEVYTDILSEFSGEAVDYEDWERGEILLQELEAKKQQALQHDSLVCRRRPRIEYD